MKTLISKDNPQIRITAPEIEICDRNCIGCYYVSSVGYCVKDHWTLVEEEPKRKQSPALKKIMDNMTEEKLAKTRAEMKTVEEEPVDLEKEAVAFCFDNGINITPYQATRIARHFYELGFNTRKKNNYDSNY